MEHTRRCEFTATQLKRDDFEHFIKILQALGVDIECEMSPTGRSARVSADVPRYVTDAEVKRTRLAGAKYKGINPPPGSVFTRDTTCREFLEWRESHTATECMEQLGLPRSTYFRRLKDIRAYMEEIDAINASRARSPEWRDNPLPPAKLGNVRPRRH